MPEEPVSFKAASDRGTTKLFNEADLLAVEAETAAAAEKLLSARIETLEAPLTRINCPGCRVAFAHPIHPRTLIQDESVLVCRTDGCKQRDKEWDVPVAVLTAHKAT